MGVNQQPGAVMLQLGKLLEQMDVCARELETITQSEYEAIRSLDAEQIMRFGARRVIVHQSLEELTQQSSRLLSEHYISSRLPLSSVIEMHAGDQTTVFQALRKNIFERIIRVDQKTQENRMRLHAAYNISTTILRSLGLAQAEQTYHRRIAE